MGLAPSAASRALPLHPPAGRLLQKHRKKSQGGWGKEGVGRVGREGLCLEGRALELQWR